MAKREVCPTCVGRRYTTFTRGGVNYTRSCRRCHGAGWAPQDFHETRTPGKKIYKKRKEPEPILYGRKLQF